MEVVLRNGRSLWGEGSTPGTCKALAVVLKSEARGGLPSLRALDEDTARRPRARLWLALEPTDMRCGLTGWRSE